MKQFELSVIFFALTVILMTGCAGAEKPVKTIAKPIRAVSDEIGKERTIERHGERIASVDPQDDKKIRISF